jgi:HAD superfamily hydrolase (TIGR01509 family)
LDLDGSLVDSDGIGITACKKQAFYDLYVEKLGRPAETAEEEYLKKMEELKYTSFTKTLLKIGGGKITNKDIDDRWDAINARELIKEPDQKLIKVLKELKEDGYSLVIFSNNTEILANNVIDALGIRGLLDGVYTSQGLGVFKPNAEVFEIVSAKMGVVPAQAISVGDSVDNDIEPAKKTGMQAIHIKKREDIYDLISQIRMIEASMRPKARPRNEDGTFKNHPGKSPGDALKVIALSRLSINQHFTLEAYLMFYEKVRRNYPELGFEKLANNPKTTAKRDLKALLNQGFLGMVYQGGVSYYFLSDKGWDEIVKNLGQKTGNKDEKQALIETVLNRKIAVYSLLIDILSRVPGQENLHLQYVKELRDLLKGERTSGQKIAICAGLIKSCNMSFKYEGVIMLRQLLAKALYRDEQIAINSALAEAYKQETAQLQHYVYALKNLSVTDITLDQEIAICAGLVKSRDYPTRRDCITSLKSLLGAGLSVDQKIAVYSAFIEAYGQEHTTIPRQSIYVSNLKEMLSGSLSFEQKVAVYSGMAKAIDGDVRKEALLMLLKEEKGDSQSREADGTFGRKLGRSPEDAITIIARSGLYMKESFTIDDYHEAYNSEKAALGFSSLPENADSQTRRDLEALIEKGLLFIENLGERGVPYRYSPTRQGLDVFWHLDIGRIIALVTDTAKYIPTHPNYRYTLLVTSEFFDKGELKAHQSKFGDRFELDGVSGITDGQFIDNALAKAKDKETRTVVLVPDNINPEQLERLSKAGIRFVQVNVSVLLQSKMDAAKDGGTYRDDFQLNTYCIMLLVRRVDDSMEKDSSIYRTLEFYIRSHFDLTDKVAVTDYINAIVKGDVARLIKGCLAYKPSTSYIMPSYNSVSAALISA